VRLHYHDTAIHIQRLGTEVTSTILAKLNVPFFRNAALEPERPLIVLMIRVLLRRRCCPMPLVLLVLLPGIFVAGFASGFGVRARISRRRRRKRAAAKLLGGGTSRHFMPTQSPLDHVEDNGSTRRRRALR
jgi:hypothetical protein